MTTGRPLALLWLCVLPVLTASGQEWPRFRGPNGSGVDAAHKLPAGWDDANILWKTPLPGTGHSSPVVWGRRVFVTSADPQNGERFALCVNADDGRELWRRSFGGENHCRHADNSLASSTPAVDDRHLYLCWGGPKQYLVLALDHDGREVWRADLGPFQAGHGFGASPIVCGDIVVVPNDQNGPGSLLGLDRGTGQVRWTVPRKTKAHYATPCVYQPPGGLAELIFTSYEHGVTAVDPLTGRVKWELDVFDKGHVECSIGSPLVAGDLLLVSCGWLGVRNEVVAVRPPSGGRPAEKVYCLDRSAPLCTTPLVTGDLVFLWSDKGVVSCADRRTGDVHWRERVEGSYYSSPVLAGGQLCNVGRDGEVVVLEAAKTFRPVTQGQLPEGTHATPALAHGRVYVRTFTHLIAVGRREQ